MVICKVCFKYLYEPYTLGCGHTFCYSVGCLPVTSYMGSFS